MVDLAILGAFFLVAAAEAILETRRFAIVRVIGCDVAPVAAFVALHHVCTFNDALVTVRSQLGTPL